MKALWILMLMAGPAFGTPVTNGAFQPGETLRYNIFWGPVIAGKATLQVVGIEPIDGHPCYHLRAKAKTIGPVGLLYSVNSSVDAWLDVEGLFTRRHEQNRKEGKRTVREIGIYDYAKGHITITNLVTGRVKQSPLPAPVCDAVSSVYHLRTKPLELNRARQLLLQEGVTNTVVTVNPDERRKLTVRPLGEVAALRLEPKPTFHLVAALNGRAWVWISDDHRRLPLLVVCSLPIGNARFVLESADEKTAGTPLDLGLSPATPARTFATASDW
jgi:hypothetical protein